MDKYKDILKKFGAGSLVSFNESDKTLTRISTGSLSLDKSLGISNEGVGGIPLGKVIEIMGAESSGKSTLCLHVIAEFQKAQDRDVLLIDGEYSFDYNYAKALGVKVEELIVSQPESLEDAYNLALDMVNTGNVALVIIDSHTSLPSRKRLENDIGKDEVALEPRIHSDALRRLKGVLDKNKCSLIGVTQLRDKVGSMFGGSQGTGGNAWKFYSDIRISGWRKTDKKNMEDIVTWSAIKNKTSIPFQEAVVPIGWGIGFDKVLETIDIGVSFDLIVKKGSWYQTPDGTSIGQGKNKVVEFMLDNPEYYQKFYEKVKNELWKR